MRWVYRHWPMVMLALLVLAAQLAAASAHPSPDAAPRWATFGLGPEPAITIEGGDLGDMKRAGVRIVVELSDGGCCDGSLLRWSGSSSLSIGGSISSTPPAPQSAPSCEKPCPKRVEVTVYERGTDRWGNEHWEPRAAPSCVGRWGTILTTPTTTLVPQ